MIYNYGNSVAAYDALAIYEYTRLPKDVYTESECDRFAASVQRIVNRKRQEYFYEDSLEPIPIVAFSYESVDVESSDESSEWNNKALGKQMLKVCTSFKKGSTERSNFCKNLAKSEAFILEAVDEFSVYLERVHGNVEGMRKEADKRAEADSQKLQEQMKAAEEENKKKMKKRIAIAAAVGAISVGAVIAKNQLDKKMVSSGAEKQVAKIGRAYEQDVEKLIQKRKNQIEKLAYDNEEDRKRLIDVIDGQFYDAVKERRDYYNRNIDSLAVKYSKTLGKQANKQFGREDSDDKTKYTADMLQKVNKNYQNTLLNKDIKIKDEKKDGV